MLKNIINFARFDAKILWKILRLLSEVNAIWLDENKNDLLDEIELLKDKIKKDNFQPKGEVNMYYFEKCNTLEEVRGKYDLERKMAYANRDNLKKAQEHLLDMNCDKELADIDKCYMEALQRILNNKE